MPVPKPIPKEDRRKFMERCVTDSKMKAEFKQIDRRLAVCFQQWRDSKIK